MKEILIKMGLYTVDLGTGLIGTGVIGLTGYGLWKFSIMLVPKLAMSFSIGTALVGALVYPAAVGAFAGITLMASRGLKKIFNWTANERQEIRDRQMERVRVRSRGNSWIENEESVVIDKSEPIEERLESIEREAGPSDVGKDKSDITEPEKKVDLLLKKDDLKNIRNKGKEHQQ